MQNQPLTALDLTIGDRVRHIHTRNTGTIKAINSLVATITMDEPFEMPNYHIMIDTQICLIENLEKI